MLGIALRTLGLEILSARGVTAMFIQVILGGLFAFALRRIRPRTAPGGG